MLNAIQILQKTTDSNLAYINSINEKPQIQLVNNNLNVKVDTTELPKESRERIVSAATALLELFKNNQGAPPSDEYVDFISSDEEENTDQII